jgi:hypothetical protein
MSRRSRERKHTPDTPFTAKSVVNVLDDGTNNKTGKLRAGIEKTDLGAVWVSKIRVPRIKCLKTRDDGTII